MSLRLAALALLALCACKSTTIHVRGVVTWKEEVPGADLLPVPDAGFVLPAYEDQPRWYLHARAGEGEPVVVQVTRLRYDMAREGEPVDLVYRTAGCDAGWALDTP